MPIDSSPLLGLDALLSTVQMPPGVPVATVAVGKAGATNAGVLAAQILALGGHGARGAVDAYKARLADKVEQAAARLAQRSSSSSQEARSTWESEERAPAAAPPSALTSHWPFWLLLRIRRAPNEILHPHLRLPREPGRLLRVEESLRARGGVAAPAHDADLVVVNTCTVTGAADQGARNFIRRVARAQPFGADRGHRLLCHREPGALTSLPGVVRLVSNVEKDAFVRELR